MSFYLSLLLAISVLGLLSRAWLQRWRARPGSASRPEDSCPGVRADAPQMQAKLESPSTIEGTGQSEQQEQLATRVSAEIAALRTRFAFDPNHPPAWATRVQQVVTAPSLRRATSQPAALAQGFRRWAATALHEEQATNAWLTALSTEAHIAFTQQLAEFCEEMGFDLTALVDGRLDSLPHTAQQATQIVRYYCRANYQAALAQDDFDATKRFLAYLRAPTQKANLAFGQHLYAKVVEKQLAGEPTAKSAVTTTATEAPTQVAETICQAAARHPTAFSAVLNEVVKTGDFFVTK